MNESNRRIISVSELNKHAKRLLESEFPLLFVEGEISNFARPRSGHWYFTLKDEKAQIRCAMFKNRNQTVKFEPKDGQQVIVRDKHIERKCLSSPYSRCQVKHRLSQK